MTATVDGLVERGLLARSAVAGDRREVRITITAAGRRTLAAAEAAMAAGLEDVLGRVPDRRALLAALADVAVDLDTVAAEHLAAFSVIAGAAR